MKRSQNNETQLQQAVSRFFRIIGDKIQSNLEQYWSDTLLLQGQVDLILKPILDSHDAYYQILEQYLRREYRLGQQEAERVVQYATNPQSLKAKKRPVRFRHTEDNLFGTLQEAEDELLTKVFIASQGTLTRVTGEINDIITQGYKDGKGINVVSNMLTDKFNQLETWGATRIARTEIHNAHNEAIMKTYETLDVEYTQWIAADDDRTRESHAELDGEIIRIGDEYSNGLKFPGDTDGPIEEWINCRCSNAPFVMPKGMTAPPHMTQFREDDLIEI